VQTWHIINVAQLQHSMSLKSCTNSYDTFLRMWEYAANWELNIPPYCNLWFKFRVERPIMGDSFMFIGGHGICVAECCSVGYKSSHATTTPMQSVMRKVRKKTMKPPWSHSTTVRRWRKQDLGTGEGVGWWQKKRSIIRGKETHTEKGMEQGIQRDKYLRVCPQNPAWSRVCSSIRLM